MIDNNSWNNLLNIGTTIRTILCLYAYIKDFKLVGALKMFGSGINAAMQKAT